MRGNPVRTDILLLSHLDGAPFMGSFEARYGSLGFLVDAIHLPVSTRITTHDVFFQGGNAELSANTGTGIPLYRFLDDPVRTRGTAHLPSCSRRQLRVPEAINDMVIDHPSRLHMQRNS